MMAVNDKKLPEWLWRAVVGFLVAVIISMVAYIQAKTDGVLQEVVTETKKNTAVVDSLRFGLYGTIGRIQDKDAIQDEKLADHELRLRKVEGK